MGRTITVPMEYFVWANQDPSSDKLIYYDKSGTYVEHSVKSGAIEEALQAFNGEVKAVRRSTGGLTTVEPFQLVLVTHDGDEWPQIRVRVRFQDVRFVEKNGVLVTEPHTHTKIVAPSELKEPFSYSFTHAQNFVVDFGHGIVPVHVVHYDVDAKGNTTAFFMDIGEAANSIHGAPGENVLIQPYQIPRNSLRWAAQPADGGTHDAQLARENYARIKRVGAEVVPDCLKAGNAIEVSTGYTLEELRDYTQLTISQRREGAAESVEPLVESMLKVDDDFPEIEFDDRWLRR